MNIWNKVITLTRGKPLRVYWAIAFLSSIWLFRRYLFFTHAFIFPDAGGDTITSFYPKILHDINYWYETGLPMWTFSIGIGQSIYPGDIGSPFSLLMFIFGPDHVPYAIGFSQYLKLILVISLSFYYLRLLKLQAFTIFIGSLSIAYCGYMMVGSTWYGHSTTILYMLLTITGMELLLQKNIWWVLPIGYFLLFGPSVIFITEFLILYILLRLAHQNSLNLKSILQVVKRLVKPAIFSLLLVSPFIFPEIINYIYSPRGGGEVSLSSGLMNIGPFGMADWNHYSTAIMRCFSSDILGIADSFMGSSNYLEAPLFYCGLLSLMMLPQVFSNLTKRQALVFGFIISFWVFIIVFPFFRFAFYLFTGNYFKLGLSLFIPFTFIYYCLIALDQLILKNKLNIILLVITWFSLLVRLFATRSFGNLGQDQSISLICAISLSLITGALIFLKHTNQKSIGKGLLGIIVFAEFMFMANYSLNNRAAISTVELHQRTGHNDYTREAVEYIKSIDPAFYRIEKTFGSVNYGYNDALAQGYFGTKSYRSHNHNNYVKFLTLTENMPANVETATRWIKGLPKVYELHSLLNIKYLISNFETDEQVNQSLYTQIASVKNLKIYENKYAIPMGFMVYMKYPLSKYKNIADREHKMNLLYKAAIIEDDLISQFPQLPEVYTGEVNNKLAWAEILQVKNSALKLNSYSQNHFEGNIQNERDGIAVFTIPKDIGWTVKVNGEKKELIEIDGGLTGLYLTKGTHSILLKYSPYLITPGWILFTISALIFVYFIYKDRNEKDRLIPVFSPVIQKLKPRKRLSKAATKKSKYRNKKKA